MPPRPIIQRIRNIGIVAHVDAGKTTCTERLLFLSGKLHRTGEVHHGDTATDFSPIERKRGITIASATATFEWSGHRIQLIDTPGHVDFSIEVERSLRVLDGAVFLLDAKNGVECQTEMVWHRADAYGVPRIVLVNKMDTLGADFDASVRSLIERLGARAVPVQLPLGEEAQPEGFIDLVSMKALVFDSDKTGRTYRTVDIPDAHLTNALAARRALVEACAEVDDDVLRAFLAGTEVDAPTLDSALRKGTLARTLVPVLCGSAYKNKGIPLVLDAVVKYLPSPADLPPVRGVETETSRSPRDDEPLSALAFKTLFSKSGNLTLLRVYSGKLRGGTPVACPSRGNNERVARLFEVFADRTDAIDEATAGMIVAVSGLRDVRTGDTVCDRKAPIVFESLSVPEPVIEVALEPKTSKDQDKLADILPRLLVEDPSLRASVDEGTGRTTLAGMGMLQLEVVCQKLDEEHEIHVTMGAPEVAYKETLTAESSADYKHSKQTGGPGQFARIVLTVSPAPRGSGVAFIDDSKGGVIPAPFVSAVEKGVRKSAGRGFSSPYPLVDVSVRLVDGTTHPQDSSAVAFETCAVLAMREAVLSARPRMLEPVMELEIVVPEGFTGVVAGDLASRRGSVRSLSGRRLTSVILGQAPLRNLFGYIDNLRSLTEGRGSASMKLSHYELLPKDAESALRSRW